MSAINEAVAADRMMVPGGSDSRLTDPVRDALQRQRALSRWDDDGGAEPDGSQVASDPDVGQPPFPRIGDAELQAFHVRVIALENLVVAFSQRRRNAGARPGGASSAATELHPTQADYPCRGAYDRSH